MQNSIDFYKGIFLHDIPVRIIVPWIDPHLKRTNKFDPRLKRMNKPKPESEIESKSEYRN